MKVYIAIMTRNDWKHINDTTILDVYNDKDRASDRIAEEFRNRLFFSDPVDATIEEDEYKYISSISGDYAELKIEEREVL